MKTLRTLVTGLLLVTTLAAPSTAGELTADLGLEANAYAKQARNVGPGQVNGSASLELEYYLDRRPQREQIIIAPFARVDLEDNDRTHFDLRELYWQKAIRDLEVSIGFRRVFWGVTESVHLADVINQTDLVENMDGEDKLGQPMVQARWLSDYGTFSLFWLPYFRERTFPGLDGRLRPSVPIEQDRALYESAAERWHQDWAVRWSTAMGFADIGLSYFNGTERQPTFIPDVSEDGSLSLLPYYSQTRQASLDLLLVLAGWLWKAEAISAETANRRHTAFASGFEYTFVGVAGSRYDLGVLAEYLYDDRGSRYTPFDHDLFVGSRIALNDIGGTSILAGAVIDSDNGSLVGSMELERRLSEWWSMQLEARAFGNQQEKDLFYEFRDDSYVRLNVFRHW